MSSTTAIGESSGSHPSYRVTAGGTTLSLLRYDYQTPAAGPRASILEGRQFAPTGQCGPGETGGRPVNRAELLGRMRTLEQRAGHLQAQAADLHDRCTRHSPASAAHAALTGQIALIAEELVDIDVTLTALRMLVRQDCAAPLPGTCLPGSRRPLWRPAPSRTRAVAS